MTARRAAAALAAFVTSVSAPAMTVVLVLVSMTAGCAAASPAAAPVVARAAWAPPTAPGATTGFVYVDLATDRATRLTAAGTAPDVARSVTVVNGAGLGGVGGHQGHLDGDGAPEPTHRATIALAAEAVTRLHPDGPHLRLDGVVHPLAAGGRFRIRLVFSSGGPVDVDVTVGDGPTV